MSYYSIFTKEDLEEAKRAVLNFKGEILDLQNSFFLTRAKKQRISILEAEISSIEAAINEYNLRQISYQKRKKATTWSGVFNVAGTTFRPTSNINSAVKYIDEYHPFDKYDGLTNKEIEESMDRVYKYYGFSTDEVAFETEPDNEYDSNAIKVLIHGNHVGYIPKDTAVSIKEFIENPKFIIEGRAEIVGGPYKEFDYLEDKIVVTKDNFGFKISLTALYGALL